MSLLFDGQAADGQSTKVVKNLADLVTVFCWGTFNGVTVKLQISPDKINWFDLTDATFTAKGTINVRIPPNVYYRGDVSGTSSPVPSVSLQVVGHQV